MTFLMVTPASFGAQIAVELSVPFQPARAREIARDAVWFGFPPGPVWRHEDVGCVSQCLPGSVRRRASGFDSSQFLSVSIKFFAQRALRGGATF